MHRLPGSVEAGHTVGDPRDGRWWLVTRIHEEEGRGVLAASGVVGVAESTEIRHTNAGTRPRSRTLRSLRERKHRCLVLMGTCVGVRMKAGHPSSWPVQ